MRVVKEKKINEEYHKVQMLTTVAMPTPYISASLSHTAYINNVVSLVRLLTEGAAWKDKAGNVSTVMQKIMVYTNPYLKTEKYCYHSKECYLLFIYCK